MAAPKNDETVAIAPGDREGISWTDEKARGRRLVLACAIGIFTANALATFSLALSGQLGRPLIALARLLLTAGLCYALARGQHWARVVAAILLILASLLLPATVWRAALTARFAVLMSTTTLLVVYLWALWVLTFSSSARAFFKETAEE